MDQLLKLLQENAALRPAQLASMLNQSEKEVEAKIKAYEADHVILGYRAILDEEKIGTESVRAAIEVKITPERGGGFDRLAERIAKYINDQVYTVPIGHPNYYYGLSPKVDWKPRLDAFVMVKEMKLK